MIKSKLLQSIKMKYGALIFAIFLSGCLFYSPPKREYFKFSKDSLNTISNLKFGFYIHEIGPANKDPSQRGRDDLPDIENYTLYEPIILLPNNEFFWLYQNAAKNKTEFCEDMVKYIIKKHSRKRSGNPYGLYKKLNETSDTLLFEKVIPIRESGKNLNYIAYCKFTTDTITIYKEVQLKRNKIIRVKKMKGKFVYYPFAFDFKSPFD